MASMEMSLDDIILKNKKPTNRGRGGGRRGQQQNRLETRRRGPIQSNANINKKRVGAQGRRGGGSGSGGGRGNGSGIGDARLRIIQKNRHKLTDARDKLAEIAKQSDARLKLQKLREHRKQGSAGSKQARAGMNITRRTGRNGQITLSTNRRAGLSTQRQVSSRQERTTSIRNLPRLMDLDVIMDQVPSSPPVLRRTVNNEMSTLPPPPLFAPITSLQRNLYTWVNPVSQDPPSPPPLEKLHGPLLRPPVLSTASLRRPTTQPTSGLKIITRNMPSQKHGPTLLSDRDEWHFESHGNVRGSNITHSRMDRIDLDDSDDEDRVRRLAPWRRGSTAIGQLSGRMSSELKARLDTPAVAPRTMGILSAPSNSAATPPTPTGHRIVVSNLQTSVTQEDIRELFEDIGPLLTSRLVRPGTAEVVYELHKDAVQAVDVYHNRQLDGQPMKCMLVNARPPTIPVTGRGIASSLRTSSSSSFKLPSGGKSSVVPDIGTIHKALFNRS